MKTIKKPNYEEILKNDGIKFEPIDGEKIVYKIVKKEKGQLKNIMRSFNGSMKIDTNKWYKAERVIGRDGSSGVDGKSSWYITGIHCVEAHEDAVKYLKNFRRKDERVIYKCIARGAQWIKPTNEKVLLVDELKFIEEM